jgi:formylglycine-generating enzyme required for sulfatase activity
MARIEKTVFVSYRRTDVYTALAVYENLKNQGYDVFFDYRSISSGDFEQIITSNIRARAHFLLILTATALDRCDEPGDWLRREIETAMDEKRNIIPLFFKGFRFGAPSVSEKLTGKLKNLSRYNGLNVHEDYFDEAMQRLRTQYLNIPLDTILHPVSTEVRRVVREEQVAADKALEQIEDVKELVKKAQVKPKPVASETNIDEKGGAEGKTKLLNPKLRLFIGVASVLLLGLLGVIGSINYISNNLFQFGTITVTSEPTRTPQIEKTNTPPPTKTLISPTPTLGIHSRLTGTDGMILLYVPADEFTMGSDNGDSDERPVHSVYLDAFWIDQTEVTNAMYAKCVGAGLCKEPTSKESYTHSSYYGNSEFDNYPVLYVDWSMAKTYCEWVGRRLPAEAEWEKAARWLDENIYPWGNTFDGTLVNFCETSCLFDWANQSFNDRFEDVAPVGSYSSGQSIYGALDMAGNVWEWVSSLYKSYPYDATDGRENLDSSEARVLRGGSWGDIDNYVRSANREWYDPARRSYSAIGFRCAMSATP